MNEKKIAFIICVNNEMEFEESRCYLEYLDVPMGYEVDVIAVTDAVSMAAGYNEAMQYTDARYKVYMHQDVFILNIDFINDILKIFQNDKKIGAIGVIGRKSMNEKFWVAADWDTGVVLHNFGNGILSFPFEEDMVEVEAVDGLIIATQYDIKWREDIFDGWDFYDISQCMEFRRQGYKVVIPKQAEPWCYHDNSYSRLKNYFVYQSLFCKEYSDIKAFDMQVSQNADIEMERLLESLKKNIELLIEKGEKKQVIETFQVLGNQNYFSVREYSAIAQIEQLESLNGVEERFWEDGMSVQELLKNLRELKHLIKKIEFNKESVRSIMLQIRMNYSIFAVAVVVNLYVCYKQAMISQIGAFYEQYALEDESYIWKEIAKEFSPGIDGR